MNSFSMDLVIVENGRQLDLTNLDEDSLDSLRDWIYEFIPEHSELCVICDEDNPDGYVSNLSYEEYFELCNNPIFICPTNTKTKNWGETVVLIFKRNKLDLSNFKNLQEHLKMKSIELQTNNERSHSIINPESHLKKIQKEKKLLFQHDVFQQFYKQLENEKTASKNTKQHKKKKNIQPSFSKYCALKLVPLKY